MIIMNEREQLLSLVDENTLEKVRDNEEFVIKTETGNILMAFPWMDQTAVLLYMEPEHTSIWAENPDILKFTRGISGTGKEELFEFFVAITVNDHRNLDELEDRVEDLEDVLLEDPNPNKENFRAIQQLRREVLHKKRYYGRMELLTDELMQIDMYFNFIDKKFDKLFGHILQTQEYLDQVRQSYEAQIDIQQNNLMKVFTVVTSFFLPLSLIAGWYGMNLIMPEFKWINGYPFVIGLCVTIVLFMLWLFRRKKWL
jgi:magnesium transporter